MNCEQASRLLVSGSPTNELEQHLAECASCRALAGFLTSLAGEPAVPEHLNAVAKAAAIPAVLVPINPAPGRVVFALRAAGAAGMVAVAGVLALGWAGFLALTSAEALAFASAAAAGLIAGLAALQHEFRPGSPRRLPAPLAAAFAALAFPLLWLWLFAWNPTARTLAGAMFCLTVGTLLAGATVWLLMLSARWGFAPDRRSAALALGSLAALTAITVQQIYCPKLELAHLILGHGGSIATAFLIAWIAGLRASARGLQPRSH